jgi:pyruvate/2-oxoglutarate dehydrogenase complex dihydrolipoamide acyltransferase (E2) component
VDLSPGQRRAIFALVVIVLAALGYYLIVPALRHSGGQAQAATSSAPASATPAASAPAPAVTAPATAAGSVNIYSWLPFTQQDLAAAASVAARFSVDYNTFTYTESASAYTSGMGGLITGQLASTLQAAYQTPGVANLRKSQKQVSTGTAVISSLRAFGSGSLTFIVNAGQRLVTSNGTTNGSTQYAVTVTGSGTSWQVNDIELASAGNE